MYQSNHIYPNNVMFMLRFDISESLPLIERANIIMTFVQHTTFQDEVLLSFQVNNRADSKHSVRFCRYGSMIMSVDSGLLYQSFTLTAGMYCLTSQAMMYQFLKRE